MSKTVSFRLSDDDIESLRYIADKMGSGNLTEAERIVIRLVRAVVDEETTVSDIFSEDILRLTGIDESPLKDVKAMTAVKRPEKLAELYENG